MSQSPLPLKQLISDYLNKAQLMQVSTCINNQPWTCTVYFAFNEQLELYWISTPTRRHSIEISKNGSVSGTIVLSHSYGEKVRGLQFEGTALVINDPEQIKKEFTYYGNKYNCLERSERIINGSDKHKLYKIIAKEFVIFDEVNYPEDPRREFKVL